MDRLARKNTTNQVIPKIRDYKETYYALVKNFAKSHPMTKQSYFGVTLQSSHEQ